MAATATTTPTSLGPQGGASPGRRGHSRTREALAAYGMVLPGLSLLLIFMLVPIIYGLWISLHRYDGFNPMTWVGLDNYSSILGDSDFRQALTHTVMYAVGSTILENALGLGLALLLNAKLKGMTFFRAAIFVPVTLNTLVIGAFFSFFLSGQNGLLNKTLDAVGLGFLSQVWLSNPSTALGTVVVVSAWASMGFFMTLYLAGLQALPTEPYEAALLDGAGPWLRFWKITLPALRPVVFVCVLLSLTGAFVHNFSLIWVMTEASKPTEVITTLMYKEAFQLGELGSASAMGYVLFGIVAIILVLYVRQTGAGEESDVQDH